jgi:hypothetical protein
LAGPSFRWRPAGAREFVAGGLVAEGPVAGRLVVGRLVAGHPSRRTPSRRTPGRRRPSRRRPSRRTPGRRTPGRRTPGRRTPSRRTPSRRTPSRRTPNRRTPGGRTRGPGRTLVAFEPADGTASLRWKTAAFITGGASSGRLGQAKVLSRLGVKPRCRGRPPWTASTRRWPGSASAPAKYNIGARRSSPGQSSRLLR